MFLLGNKQRINLGSWKTKELTQKILSTTRLIMFSYLFGRTYLRINGNYTYVKITELPPYFIIMIITSVLISVMTAH